MKQILLLCVLSVIGGEILSAQTVQIVSPSEVRIDGENAGILADAIANNRALAPKFQTALTSYIAAQGAAKDATISVRDAEITKLKADLAAANKLRDDSVSAYQSVKPVVMQMGIAAGVSTQAIATAIEPLEAQLKVATTPAEQIKLEELKKKKAAAEAQAAAFAAEIAAKEAALNQ